MDHLVEPALLNGPGRQIEQYRVLARVLVLMFCMCSLGGIWLLIHQETVRGLSSEVAAIGLVVAAACLRYGKPVLSTWLMLGTLALLTTFLAMMDGGIYSTSPAWLPVLGLMGTATLGRRGGVLYAGVLVVLLAMLAFADSLGIPVAPVSSTPMGRMSAIVGLVVCGVAVVFWWSAERDRHLVRVEGLAAERDAQAREAQRAADIKIRFLETMSHELRTPLNHVLGGAREMARTAMPLESRRLLVEVEGGAEALNAMVDDVLDVIALGDGALILDDGVIHLPDLLQYLSDRWGREATRRGLDLQVAAEGDLPRDVMGDRKRILQILAQLFDNALRYTDRGQVVATVRAEGDRLRFRVQDTGPGLATEDRERVFLPFEQGREVHRRHGGRGLGLTLARGLARAMGGDVRIVPEPLVGACLEVDLPLRVSDARPQAPTAFPPARVLVVDDSPLNRKIVRNLLERRGLVVEEAPHGQAAVEAVQRLPPDLVLMDIEMPILDGYGATETLRELGFRLPVVALSAHTLPEAVARGRAAGMDAHLGKPVDPEAVCAVLARWIPPNVDGQAA
jgi:signal transduction histidine kinase/ActR/RegA family two-component response regulator